MKISKFTAITAGLALCFCLAACGETDSSSGAADSNSKLDITLDTSKKADENDSSSQEAYDPNGDVRLFDGLKSEFSGNYKLTGNLSVNDGDPYAVLFEVKGDLRYASATISGMMTERYITAEGDLYVINQATTTYEKYNSAELGNTILNSPQYDPFFAATGDFVKASVDNGVIYEEYNLDFQGISGSIVYSFNESTRNIQSIEIKSDDMDNELLTDIAILPADDEDFKMPDISGYTRNN